MFPISVNLDIPALNESENQLKTVFLFDFDTKQYVLKNGRPVEATYTEAIRQWVTMLITTELDQYPVYQGTGFGLVLKNYIGRRDVPIAAINSELRRQIEEKVIMHSQIVGIDNFKVTTEGGKSVISFTVKTVKGNIDDFTSEVSIDGRYF
ncbi:DUF2634 domain-containing protein [Paenibacillus thailandensis]|uniref:DUF2634 domain-containing protein n=1 Tax=Paenibacillus thailandensis TaxID=393250 RepID=A0ABW5R3Z4_9BACL